MSIELLAIPEPLLKERFYVYFTKGWKELGDKFFEIKVTQQIPREVWKILDVGKTHDLVLKDEGFIPENPKTLYEVYVGLKGNVLLYPRLPSTKYFLALEKSGFVPNPADDELRYLGAYTEADTPYDEPRLRFYAVKDMEPPVFRLYCDSIEPEKAVLRFIVNRCRIEPVTPEIEKALRAKKIPYKEIKHYTRMIW